MYTLIAAMGGVISLWGICVWLACGFFARYLGEEKGRCGICWLILGLLFGPFALLAIAGSPVKGPSRKTHAQCHACHEFVLPEARKCKHCHSEFAPDGYTRDQNARNDKVHFTTDGPRKSVSNPMLLVGIVVVVVLLYFVFSLPASAQLNDDKRTRLLSFCGSISELAISTMKLRQMGMPMREAMELTRGDGPMVQFTEPMVLSAYELPLAHSDAGRELIMKEFVDQQYLECIKTVKKMMDD